MTDEELMAAVCLGDRNAYQTLVRRHLNNISHYAFRLTRDRGESEDITQEVFLRLWTTAQRWDADKSRPATWLFRIAHNLCIDSLRKRRVHLQSEFDETVLEHQMSGADSNNEQRREIRAALDKLPERQRTALALCHYQGFSNAEAAAILDVSVEALESALARARRSLRRIVMDGRDRNDD